jgi:hypothetical protein
VLTFHDSAGVPVQFENQATQCRSFRKPYFRCSLSFHSYSVIRDGDHECLFATSNNDGAAVQWADCEASGPESTSWIVTKGSAVGGGAAPSGPIKIFGNKCLDVTNGVNSDGTPLQIWTCSGGPNQNFNVNADSTITWTNSNKCVDSKLSDCDTLCEDD